MHELEALKHAAHLALEVMRRDAVILAEGEHRKICTSRCVGTLMSKQMAMANNISLHIGHVSHCIPGSVSFGQAY